jgi:hypothetical protein
MSNQPIRSISDGIGDGYRGNKRNRVLVLRSMSEVAQCYPLKPSGNYLHHLLQELVTPHFVFMCFVCLSEKRYYFLKQHKPVDLCNGEELFSLRYGLN